MPTKRGPVEIPEHVEWLKHFASRITDQRLRREIILAFRNEKCVTQNDLLRAGFTAEEAQYEGEAEYSVDDLLWSLMQDAA